MLFQDILSKSRESLIQSVPIFCEEFASYPIPHVTLFKDILVEYTLRGKMLRGSFVRLSVEAMGQWDVSYEKIAVALELAQSALLIHDDVMDNDDLRRGSDAVHVILANQLNVSKEIGQSLAICLGDASIFYIFSLLSEHKDVLDLFAREFTRTAFGQAFDILASSRADEMTRNEIETIIVNKTAYYTFVVPFVVGAILTNNHHTIPVWQELGELLGKIFQIRDDELNYLFPNSSGKSSVGDIRENKKTLCRFSLIQEFPNLEPFFGQIDYIDEIRQCYHDSQTKIQIQNLVQQYKSQAQSLIKQLPLHEPFYQTFEEILEYLIHRES